MTTLSVEQDRMLELLLRKRNGLSFGGYAGTGKTTVLAELARRDRTVIFAAPTNKAAAVLRSKMPKGTDVRTFHALTQMPMLDEKGMLIGFNSSNEPLEEGTHVVVDEASMIGEKTWRIAARALEHATVNLVGDPAQLPPVNDDPIFKMADLTMILREVHRQANQSPVLELATRVREQNKFEDVWLDELGIDRIGALALKRSPERMEEIWQGCAQFLCFTNLTRRNMNRAVRTSMGNPSPEPDIDDMLTFYMRENTDGVPRWNNGSTARVMDVIESLNGAHNIAVELDGGGGGFGHDEITVYEGILDAESPQNAVYDLPDHLRGAFACASYSYGLTVHKAQGSEWDKVYLQGNNKPRGLDGIRWLYTGITRAANELVWVE